MSTPIVVVGAGAAGIFAAWRAASLGRKVLLLEKNPRIGIKILISGGGKCNITHHGDVETVLKGFRPNEARFLRPSFYRFKNEQVLQMLGERGLETYVRPDGRVFPVSGSAKDVVRILSDYLDDSGVEYRLSSPVQRIVRDEKGVCGIEVNGDVIPTRQVILSVGGSSYPGSGTTGDGYPWAVSLGHSLVKVRAALAPIVTEPEPVGLAGVAIRDCVLKARIAGKEIARWSDDVLFTHHGVSGPSVLGISRVVAERIGEGRVSLEVDLLPAQTFETLGAELTAWSQANPRRTAASLLDNYLPKALVPLALSHGGVEGSIAVASLQKKQRNRLVEVLKAFPLGLVRHVVLEKGEVVAGGIPLGEVDPQSMRSLRCAGLYLCGEILDIAGPVGGYNLQAAFSTGFVAGESSSADLDDGK